MSISDAARTSAAANDGQLINQVQRLREARERMRAETAKVIVGQEEVMDLLLLGLLCRGHVLLHGVPGLGKTLMANTLAKTLQLKFKRVQFTPDLMPSDITCTLGDSPMVVAI